jgi:DNA-binding GntR family transcriptional regulator
MLTPLLGASPDRRLAAQAYEQLLDLIMSGRLPPGTMIQERRLAEHLHMSRTPLRDALIMLEHDGLVSRPGGRGLQVRHLDLDGFIENLAIRLLLEPEAARLAAGRIPAAMLDGIRVRLEALLAGAVERPGAPDRSEVRSLDDELHSAITAAAGNRQMEAIVRTLRRQTQMFDLRSMPERLEATCREHLAVVAALAAGQRDAAADAMRTHLDGVRQSIVQRLARTR